MFELLNMCDFVNVIAVDHDECMSNVFLITYSMPHYKATGYNAISDIMLLSCDGFHWK